MYLLLTFPSCQEWSRRWPVSGWSPTSPSLGSRATRPSARWRRSCRTSPWSTWAGPRSATTPASGPAVPGKHVSDVGSCLQWRERHWLALSHFMNMQRHHYKWFFSTIGTLFHKDFHWQVVLRKLYLVPCEGFIEKFGDNLFKSLFCNQRIDS